jgi:hypothetical protein
MMFPDRMTRMKLACLVAMVIAVTCPIWVRWV